MKLKKTLAAIIAATTMAVGLGGTSVISSATIGEQWNFVRDSNGNIIKALGGTDIGILGTPISMSIYEITLNMTHTTAATAADQVLVSVALNDSSTTRYMSSSVLVMNQWGHTIFDTAKYSSGDYAPHGACTANNTISNSSLGSSGTYWLCYGGILHGGTSYHAAVQSEIEFQEQYIID